MTLEIFKLKKFYIIKNGENSRSRYLAAYHLGKCANENTDIVERLWELLDAGYDVQLSGYAVNGLLQLHKRKLLVKMVAKIKKYFLDEECSDDSFRIARFYDNLAWHCTFKLSYPEFYSAWYGELS